MDRVKTSFSIKNLEHLSGIKAHTIRIWEKRYSLFEPERTETNIRLYNLDSLQKLLNVSMLYKNGFKISKIASTHSFQKEIAFRRTLVLKRFQYKDFRGSLKMRLLKTLKPTR